MPPGTRRSRGPIERLELCSAFFFLRQFLISIHLDGKTGQGDVADQNYPDRERSDFYTCPLQIAEKLCHIEDIREKKMRNGRTAAWVARVVATMLRNPPFSGTFLKNLSAIGTRNINARV